MPIDISYARFYTVHTAVSTALHTFYRGATMFYPRIEDERGVSVRRVYSLSLNNNCHRLVEDNVLYPRY